MTYTVEYGSRSNGNKIETFETLDEAREFASYQWTQEEIDFVTIYSPDGEEIPEEGL